MTVPVKYLKNYGQCKSCGNERNENEMQSEMTCKGVHSLICLSEEKLKILNLLQVEELYPLTSLTLNLHHQEYHLRN